MSDEEVINKVREAFERAWAKTTKERENGAFIPVDEKDLQLHLACSLREELREFGWANWVHMDFPIPLEPERLDYEPFEFGSIVQKDVRKPDIAVVNTAELPWKIYLIAEVKYIIPKALVGGYLPGLLGEVAMKALEDKEFLKPLVALKEEGLLEELLERMLREVRWFIDYGEDMLLSPVISDLEKVSSLMRVYGDAGMRFPGYVCVMDEIYGFPAFSRPTEYEELMRRHEENFPDVELLYFSARKAGNILEGIIALEALIKAALSKREGGGS